MAYSKQSIRHCHAPVRVISRLCSAGDMGRMASLFSYSNLVHAVAGAVGSAVSMIVFYPLETARTRLQIDEKRKSKHSPEVIRDIVKDEGLLSLYRGVFPVVTTLCCSNFVYFYTYSGLKAVFISDGVKPDPTKDLMFGFVAGVVNVLITTPLWVVNTRLKVQGAKFETEKYQEEKKVQYKGIIDALIKIVKYEGLSTLWNGTKPSLVLATNPSIHFMVYETVKRYFQRYLKQEDLSGFLYFIIGAIAKTVATILTYPIQIIQTRMRAGYNKDIRSQSVWEALQSTISNHGFGGLYKGMEAKLLQTVLTAALMFMVYEKIAATIFHVMGQDFVKKA